MRKLYISLALILIALGGFAVTVGIIFAINQHRADTLVETQTKIQNEETEIANADDVGGTTVEETLARFELAVRDGNAEQAAALCVPALRDRVRTAVAELSEEQRNIVADEINGVIQKIEPVEGETFTAIDPVYVELIRYPSQVWKIASF